MIVDVNNRRRKALGFECGDHGLDVGPDSVCCPVFALQAGKVSKDYAGVPPSLLHNFQSWPGFLMRI